MLRRLLAVSALVGAALALPAQAAPAGPVTVTGAAGTFTSVVLEHGASISFAGNDVLLKASRGDLVGLALVDSRNEHWLTVSHGQVIGTTCAFGTPCSTYDFPDVSGDTYDDTGHVTLPAGTYRLALLGRPGSRVQATLSLDGLHGTLTTDRTAHLTVASLASSLPSTPDQQPRSEAAFSPRNTGPAIVGAVVRLDTEDAYRANIGYCFGTQEGAVIAGLTVSPGIVCPGSPSTSGGVGIYYSHCPGGSLPAFVCVPTGVGADALSVSVTGLLPANAYASFGTETRALRSRASVTAFSLSF